MFSEKWGRNSQCDYQWKFQTNFQNKINCGRNFYIINKKNHKAIAETVEVSKGKLKKFSKKKLTQKFSKMFLAMFFKKILKKFYQRNCEHNFRRKSEKVFNRIAKKILQIMQRKITQWIPKGIANLLEKFPSDFQRSYFKKKRNFPKN